MNLFLGDSADDHLILVGNLESAVSSFVVPFESEAEPCLVAKLKDFIAGLINKESHLWEVESEEARGKRQEARGVLDK